MRNSILTKAFLCSLLVLLFSCSNDSEVLTEPEQGKTSLSFAAVLNDLIADRGAVKQQLGDFPECSADAPAFVDVVVSLSGEPVAGTFDEPLRLSVGYDDGIYFTLEAPELELEPGIYQLEYFSVLNEDLQLIWLAPREEPGEDNFAALVDSPLPLEIDLRAFTKKYVNVDVLCFDDRQVNSYGYLFFDILPNRAIEFCIFGNFCDENGRHAEAMRFAASVWTYSGNQGNPRGELLYENEENGIIVEDDFENGVSTTYATPLCLSLPDGQGLDRYYVEISLLDGLGYNAPGSPVIRSGVISDEEVRSLFDGADNVDYFHLREGNCNLNDSPDLF